MTETIHFLLVYSYSAMKLVEQLEFTDADEAAEAYRATEREYRDRSDEFEVVLVGADSIDTVKRTHGQYFSAAAVEVQLAKSLRHAVA